MSAPEMLRALVLALRGDDKAMAKDAAVTLRALGWTARQVRKARKP